MSALIVGVDPGLTTGLFAITYTDDRCIADKAIAVQIHGSEGVIPLIQALLARKPRHEHLLAVEQFVVGARAARSSSAHAGRVTRALIAELHDLGADVFIRAAALVKPWATDQRLHAAGLLDATKGMQHARDASRHALYAAVRQGLAVDPLSKEATR
jgi:hypothetical protein